jgi:hypothetical protein
MWEQRRLTTLWAFTACYRDSFIIIWCKIKDDYERYVRRDLLAVVVCMFEGTGSVSVVIDIAHISDIAELG